MIDKELKKTGTIIKVIDKFYSKNTHGLLSKYIKNSKATPFELENITCEEHWLPREDGTKLRVCVFKPSNLKPTDRVPGVLWLHGGTFIFGSPEISKATAERLIETRPCVVVVPAYTLAIEKPYPAALNDAYTTLLWMRYEARSLGIKSNQLMIGGYNSGGNLAAATTLYARDKGEVALAFQMPLYPMLDDRLHEETLGIYRDSFKNSKIAYNGWRSYLGNLYDKNSIPSYAAPARAKNFKKLPPAVTFVGEFDITKRETSAYVEKLKNAGVEVKFKVFHGCYHGFDSLCPNAKVSKDAIKFLMEAFSYAVDNYYAEQNNLIDINIM